MKNYSTQGQKDPCLKSSLAPKIFWSWGYQTTGNNFQIRISPRIRNQIRKWFWSWIREPNGDSWKKTEAKDLVLLSLSNISIFCIQCRKRHTFSRYIPWKGKTFRGIILRKFQRKAVPFRGIIRRKFWLSADHTRKVPSVSWIYQPNQNNIPKYFQAFIRGLWGVNKWKKLWPKISCYSPFNAYFLISWL